MNAKIKAILVVAVPRKWQAVAFRLFSAATISFIALCCNRNPRYERIIPR